MTARNGNKSIPQETIIRGATKPWGDLGAGVSLQLFASSDCGAQGFCTAMATFGPRAVLPYHRHQFSEAITVLKGNASVTVEGRTYLLDLLDCIHVPKGLPHLAANVSTTRELKLLSAFADSQPLRELASGNFAEVNRGGGNPAPGDPEHIQRFCQTEKYELAGGPRFADLFASRFGSVDICGGYGEFAPGTSLPCHVHDFGESITIIIGEAVCQAAGNKYSLRDFDTAFIPEGLPHRFFNETQKPMAMIWVYAGNEPTRRPVEPGYCSGALPRRTEVKSKNWE